MFESTFFETLNVIL